MEKGLFIISLSLWCCAPIWSQSQELDSKQLSLKGIRILCFSSSTTAAKPAFDRASPIWKALKEEGVTLAFATSSFPRQKLDKFDQLWLFSGPKHEARSLTKSDFDAIVEFVRSDKGLYVLSDNFPNTFESNALVKHFFDARVEGNYKGMQTLTFPQSSTASNDKQPTSTTHPLIAGMTHLAEGITISHISESKRLKTIITASDGKPLVAVSSSESLRVVVDCGYTRFFYLPKVNGNLYKHRARFARNVAMFLAGRTETQTTQNAVRENNQRIE